MKLAIDVSILEEGETKLEFDPKQELLSSSKIQSMENESHDWWSGYFVLPGNHTLQSLFTLNFLNGIYMVSVCFRNSARCYIVVLTNGQGCSQYSAIISQQSKANKYRVFNLIWIWPPCSAEIFLCSRVILADRICSN